MQEIKICSICNTELTQKSKPLLFSVGMLMIASLAAVFISAWFWIPGTFLAIIGAYLMAWSTVGKGLWCRTCKKAPFMS